MPLRAMRVSDPRAKEVRVRRLEPTTTQYIVPPWASPNARRSIYDTVDFRAHTVVEVAFSGGNTLFTGYCCEDGQSTTVFHSQLLPLFHLTNLDDSTVLYAHEIPTRYDVVTNSISTTTSFTIITIIISIVVKNEITDRQPS